MIAAVNANQRKIRSFLSHSTIVGNKWGRSDTNGEGSTIIIIITVVAVLVSFWIHVLRSSELSLTIRSGIPYFVQCSATAGIMCQFVNKLLYKSELCSRFLHADLIRANRLSSITSERKLEWNRVVSDAERVVGYPTSYLSLRCLLSDEISNLAAHVRKLIGTGHPLLKTAKRLIYNGKNYMHTRGLIVLLVSKTAGHKADPIVNDPITDGISHRQRSLAEITEMIHMAHQIHRGVVNVSSLLFPDRSTMQDMEFGNKVAVLCGDYLLASASKTLASLKDSQVLDLITKAMCCFTQAEFIGRHDLQGNPISLPIASIEGWMEKNYLMNASLLASSCKSAVLLAGHGDQLQEKAFSFGKNVALAWQVQSELVPFTDPGKHPPGTPFDLTSSPVIIHLKDDPELLGHIEKYSENLDNVDYKMVREAVLSGPGIDEAKRVCTECTKLASTALEAFEKNDASKALRNIVDVISDQNQADDI